MIKPTIAVTGATGKTGSVVSSELLKAGYPIRAMVHREDSRSATLKALGAEIVVAEMSDVERVVGALDGAQRAYYCPPIDPYAIQGAVTFAIAAKEARLEHIVSLTQWLYKLLPRREGKNDRRSTLCSIRECGSHTRCDSGTRDSLRVKSNSSRRKARRFPVCLRHLCRWLNSRPGCRIRTLSDFDDFYKCIRGCPLRWGFLPHLFGHFDDTE